MICIEIYWINVMSKSNFFGTAKNLILSDAFLENLIYKNKRNGHLTYNEINNALDEVLDVEQEIEEEVVEGLYDILADKGIEVVDEAEDNTEKEDYESNNFNDVIKNLIEKGKKDGFLTYDGIDECLDNALDVEQELTEEEIERLYDILTSEGIEVVDEKEDDSHKNIAIDYNDPQIQKALDIKELIKERKRNFKPIYEYVSSKKSAFDYFMEDLVNTPEITQIEETGALALLAKNGDIEARNLLVEGFIRIPLRIAKDFYLAYDILDLIQEGCLGLIKAVNKFDIDRKRNFHSIGFTWAWQSITRAIADQARAIRLPVHMLETVNRFIKVSRRLLQELGREPSIEEITQHMYPVDKEEIKQQLNQQLGRQLTNRDKKLLIDGEIRKKIRYNLERVREIIKISYLPISLETPVDQEGESLLKDVIEYIDIKFEEDTYSLMLKEKIEDVMENLTEREKKTLKLRFGQEKTLAEIGQEFGLTRERIRQIEEKALKKLRHPAHSKKLRDYWEFDGTHSGRITNGILPKQKLDELFDINNKCVDLENKEYYINAILNFLETRIGGHKKHLTYSLKEIIKIILSENEELSNQEIYSETLDYANYSEASIWWCLTKNSDTFMRIGDKWTLTEKYLSTYSRDKDQVQTDRWNNIRATSLEESIDKVQTESKLSIIDMALDFIGNTTNKIEKDNVQESLNALDSLFKWND